METDIGQRHSPFVIPILPLPSCIFSKVCHWLTCDGLQGVNKHNGETVAVKTFNQLSHMRPQEVQMREFEVSPGRHSRHRNIR